MRVGTVLLLAWLLVFAQSLLLVHGHEHDAHEPAPQCELCLHLSFLDDTPVSELPAGLARLVDGALHRDFLPQYFLLLKATYEARAPPARLAA